MRALFTFSKVPQWIALYGVVFMVFMMTAGALHHSEPVKQARMERQVATVEVREVKVTITPLPNAFASSTSTNTIIEATSSSEIVSEEDLDSTEATPTPEFRELLLDEAASTRSAAVSTPTPIPTSASSPDTASKTN